MRTAVIFRNIARRYTSSLEKHATAVAAALTALAVAAVLGWELATAGAQVDDWDYLFVSGCLTTLGGLWLARGQPQRFFSMFDRLTNRDALEADSSLTPQAVATMRDELRERAERWSKRSGIVLGVGIAVAWVAVNTKYEDVRPFLEVMGPLVGFIGGYFVGRELGRMLSYGMLGLFLARRRVTFRATPEHVDGAGGLKPVGDYYLSQALLLALPAVFLLFWSLMFLMPHWAGRYDAWRETYLALLAVAIALEIAAFVWPMWHAHMAMKQAKQDALITADTTLARDIAEVRAQLEGELGADDRSNAQDRLDRLTTRYDAIETMPTWPIDRALRRRVTLGNAGLILGLAAQVVALAGWS